MDEGAAVNGVELYLKPACTSRGAVVVGWKPTMELCRRCRRVECAERVVWVRCRRLVVRLGKKRVNIAKALPSSE